MGKYIKHISTSLFILVLSIWFITLESCGSNINVKERCLIDPTLPGCNIKPERTKNALQDKLNTYGRYFAYYVSRTILPLMKMKQLSIGINKIANALVTYWHLNEIMTDFSYSLNCTS